jgi:5-methylcytosine-specific restriction endonuclease McrA
MTVLRDTLLLDLGFRPLKVIPWQRALCMHFGGKVEVVSLHDWEVRTISRAYPAPAVVRLLRAVSARPLHVRFSRENVYLRDGHRCQYCGLRCGPRELTLDHVVPRSRGGKTTWRNVVTACVACNRRKGRATPEQVGMKLRTIPQRPDWLAPRLFALGEEHVPPAWRDWLH